MEKLTIIGGGLAGSEAAWQAAENGIPTILYEMRPVKGTGAHTTDQLAELVCSNSLGSNLPDRASGVLKNELRILKSLLLKCAEESMLPAGGALAVDRELFSTKVTSAILNHPNIKLVRKEVAAIPEGPVIIASGPLTSDALAQEIGQLTGKQQLFFYDAIAPVISRDSIDLSIAFRGSRYDKGLLEEGDYINCPFTKEEYDYFINELKNAQRIDLKFFENTIEEGVIAGAKQFFEGCLPVEVLANRNEKSLAFGPMRPVGLVAPQTNRRPYAILQLRQDNLIGTLYNMVGFQTNLTFSEQKRVFRLIPGLKNAEFIRYGQMHRNTYIASPDLLKPTLQFINRENLFFAGQIIGVEGYMGNIATGLMAGINAANLINKKPLLSFPESTMLGALCKYITQASLQDFQPMKANFGILPEPEHKIKSKRERAAFYANRALDDMQKYLASTINN